MKLRSKLTVILLFGMVLTATSRHLKLTINHDSGIYHNGETVQVNCHMDSLTGDSVKIRIYLNNKLQEVYTIKPDTKDFTIIDTSCNETSCAVMAELSLKNEIERIGFVVNPEGFKPGYSEPSDFMDYWNNQKMLLNSLPMQVKAKTLQVPEKYEGKYECQDVEINCLGSAPARHILTDRFLWDTHQQKSYVKSV